jgi:repressor LexA
MASTECVNEWHPECTIAACVCECHGGKTPAVLPPPAPTPRPAASRERVFDALVAYHREHGYAPSVRDLCAATGLATGTVNYHVHRLDAEGRVRLARGRARTVTPRLPAEACA